MYIVCMAFLDFIPMIGDVVGSAISNTWGYSQSKKLMRYQQDLQQQMVDRQNQYNSPQAQMDRLAAAGLSPNLVYNGGNVTGNQSASLGVSPVNRRVDFNTGVESMVATRLQRQNIDSIVKNRDQQNAESLSRTIGNMLRNKVMRETMPTQIEQAKANLGMTLASMENKLEQTNNLKIEAYKLNAEIDNIIERTNLTKAQIKTELCKPEEVKARAKYLREQAATTEKQREVMDSIIRMNDAHVEQFMASAFELWSRGRLEQFEGDIQEQISKFSVGGNITPKDIMNFMIQLVKSMAK